MTRENIIRMAREVELDWLIHNRFYEDHIQRFADLVAAEEREACAKVVDEMADQMVADMEPSTAVAWVRNRAAAIRARGNT
jgi:hypothetical protein